MRILDRYVLKEFILPFVLCMAGFSVILMSGLLFDLSDLIFNKRVAVDVVGRMLAYKLPSLVVISLPISVLFATLVGLGRLAKDRELDVMRTAGTGLARIAVPVLLTGLFVSLLTYTINEYVVPQANHRYATLVRQEVFKDAMPSVEEDIIFRGSEGRYFYVGEVDRTQRVLHKILIYETKGHDFPAMITAKQGRYQDKVWYLEDGVYRTFDSDGFVEIEQGFKTLTYPVTEGMDVMFGEQKTTDEMSRRELMGHIRLFRRSGIEVRRFLVDFHLKLALPFASFILALVGAPLSMQVGRAGRGAGIALAIVLLFVYYVLTAVSRSLGGNGLLVPLLAAWLANGLFLLSGAFLMVEAQRG